MAGELRLELRTFGFGDRCTSQLCYSPIYGASIQIRTETFWVEARRANPLNTINAIIIKTYPQLIANSSATFCNQYDCFLLLLSSFFQ